MSSWEASRSCVGLAGQLNRRASPGSVRRLQAQREQSATRHDSNKLAALRSFTKEWPQVCVRSQCTRVLNKARSSSLVMR